MRIPVIALLLPLFLATGLAAQEKPDITGSWVINDERSDNTDKQVEKALREAGTKIKRRLFDNREDRYRGGPEEQELYDRISYDDVLTINRREDQFTFRYDDDYIRPVYTDNRSRSVSLSALEEVKDFSFAHWEDETLLVEARPRDGGFTEERYRLNEAGMLEVDLYIQPRTFLEPITIHRVYQRPGAVTQ